MEGAVMEVLMHIKNFIQQNSGNIFYLTRQSLAFNFISLKYFNTINLFFFLRALKPREGQILPSSL